MDRQIIDYLPEYMRVYREMQAISSGEQIKFEEMYENIFKLLNNNYILDADETAISRYEKILRIIPLAKDTLEERRIRVQAGFLDYEAYTMYSLIKYLSFFLGEYGYEIYMNYNEYSLEVRVSLGNKNNVGIVEAYLKKNVPANIVVKTTIKFNNHSDIRKFKYAELSKWTHDQIKSEVL